MSINIKIRRLIARYLNPIVELFYKIKLNNTSFKKAPPIIIITPGKVASSSIYDTLKKNIDNPIYHIHLFSQSSILNSIEDNLNSDRKYAPLHLTVSKLLSKKMSNYNGDAYIITVIREPISRAISSFFQNSAYYRNEIEDNKLQIKTDKAKQLLFKDIDSGICNLLENWFETEIKDNFGIDVYETEFDNEKKYKISHYKKNHHLLLKMEDIDDIFPKAIQEFLNLKKPISLLKSNVGENKHYAKAYKEIKNNIKLPSKKLKEIINSKYFQHFYKDKELEVINKWGED